MHQTNRLLISGNLFIFCIFKKFFNKFPKNYGSIQP